MRETTKIPRVHAKLAIKFYSDSKMKCWFWDKKTQTWLHANSPGWFDGKIYEVSETEPTHKPKKKVTVAGITFSAPETEAPGVNTRYWNPDTIAVSVKTFTNCWKGDEFDRHLLERGFVHLKKEDAKLHAEALIKLSKELK